MIHRVGTNSYLQRIGLAWYLNWCLRWISEQCFKSRYAKIQSQLWSFVMVKIMMSCVSITHFNFRAQLSLPFIGEFISISKDYSNNLSSKYVCFDFFLCYYLKNQNYAYTLRIFFHEQDQLIFPSNKREWSNLFIFLFSLKVINEKKGHGNTLNDI